MTSFIEDRIDIHLSVFTCGFPDELSQYSSAARQIGHYFYRIAYNYYFTNIAEYYLRFSKSTNKLDFV